MSRTLLFPSWIIDGSGEEVITDHVIAIRGEHINAVEPREDFAVHSDDVIVDLPGMSVLPGLINNHVHLVLPGDGTPILPWIDSKSDVELTLLATHNAEKSLRAGVTTVRDCGGKDRIVLHVRDAQESGLIQGPRIISCGWPLTITGGHCRQFGGEVDGVEASRQMVRRVVGAGADYVKVMASGGGTPGSLPRFPSFNLDELRAIVDEAHSFGLLVAAHANPVASISNCLEANVDLIEHAAYFGADYDVEACVSIAHRIAEAKVPVTATLGVSRDVIDSQPDGPTREHRIKYGEAQRQNMRNLRELGASVLAGSDAGWLSTGFDTFWKELDELVISGMSPIEAVHSATGATSSALGYAESFGTIKPGLAADLIAVEGDVSLDIGLLASVGFVYQRGTLVHAQ